MIIRDEQWAHFFKLVEAGASISDATAHAGMSREAVYKRRDRDEDFALRLETAIVAPKLRAITVIQKAMINHWVAAAWWLERKYPAEFALKMRELEKDDDVPQRMAERAKELLDKLEKKGVPANANSNGNGVHP